MLYVKVTITMLKSLLNLDCSANPRVQEMQKSVKIGGGLLHRQSGGSKLNLQDVQIVFDEQFTQGA